MATQTNPNSLKNIEKAHNPVSQAKAAQVRTQNARLRSMIYEELKNRLTDTSKKGQAYYQEYLNKFLDIAKKDPNSKCGQMVAGTIFQSELLSMLDAEHEKEMAQDRDFTRYRLIKELFREQREVVLETNHSKRVLVCCSRRAGKTDLASDAINYAAVIPNSRIIYINLTFTNAINQIWQKTIDRAAEAGLVIDKSSKADGTIEYSNGSSVRIVGNSNKAEIDKLRGEGQVSLVIIDEFFHQKNMQYGIDEVITPFLADRQDSTILCMGTPPKIAKTYGEKCWNEKGWKKFHWTMFDNPYMPNPQEFLDEYCRNKGISEESPFVQREYYGKIGIYDTEALVFKDRKTYNVFDENEPITDVVIGVDYGFSDYNAITTIVYNKNTKHSKELKTSKFNKAGVSDIIDKIQEHYNEAKELLKKNNVNDEHIAIYCDTNEESITYDLRNKYKLPAFNCYKYDKMYAIELLAEELRTGRMQIIHNGVLDEEMEQILYKRDDEDNVISELDEEIGIHPDAMMALLYASRKIFFDFDYDISFKESAPKTSDYIKTESGTIIEVATEPNGNFTDSGIVG